MVLRFEETPEGLDIDLGAVDKEEIAHKFSNGDNVLVVEGELQNLQVQLYIIYRLKNIVMSPFIFFILGFNIPQEEFSHDQINFILKLRYHVSSTAPYFFFFFNCGTSVIISIFLN